MADLSKIKLNGTTYNFKDAWARTALGNYLQKTDIAAWAKAANKPSYTASEVGAVATTAPAAGITNQDITNWNNKLSSAPVTSVNSKTGAVVLKTSDLQNDSGYLTLATLPIYDGTVV